MAVTVLANTPLASAIQQAVQPKLLENSWVAEENDPTLAEYITMMLVNGKTEEEMVPELGTDLLGVSDNDPSVKEFVSWLFQQVESLGAPAVKEEAMEGLENERGNGLDAEAQNFVPGGMDAKMDDAQTSDAPTAPSGPKAMRNGSGAQRSARGQRIINQVNKQLAPDAPDALRRIKGAATGQTGRINAHAGREPPRGPRQKQLANGVNRMMNGRPGQMMPQMNPQVTMNAAADPMNMNSQQTMQLLQMMEQQSAMLAQMLTPGQQQQFGGGMPTAGYINPKFQQQGKSLFDRVDKKNKNKRARTQNDGDADMQDSESTPSDPATTPCTFKLDCTNPSCPYAHQGPATPRDLPVIDMTDPCAFGAACTNKKCTGRHPSPAQRTQHAQATECKFYPNCTNPKCPFVHPDMPACRFGADCKKPGCIFSHSKIMCRYTPCTNPYCIYKHADGQKVGKFEDKVWTAEGMGGGEGFDREALLKKERTERFKGLNVDESKEELVLPGSGLKAEESSIKVEDVQST